MYVYFQMRAFARNASIVKRNHDWFLFDSKRELLLLWLFARGIFFHQLTMRRLFWQGVYYFPPRTNHAAWTFYVLDVDRDIIWRTQRLAIRLRRRARISSNSARAPGSQHDASECILARAGTLVNCNARSRVEMRDVLLANAMFLGLRRVSRLDWMSRCTNRASTFSFLPTPLCTAAWIIRYISLKSKTKNFAHKQRNGLAWILRNQVH